MNIKTISRLFFIAAGHIQGEASYQACYHFGTALALSNLSNTEEDDYNGYDREADIRRHVGLGMVCFRQAKLNNKVIKRL